MGTWSRNFLAHKVEASAVRECFVRWMERRGFDLVARPPLFDCDKQDERCAFLFSSSQWTVLLYNSAFEEGDRVLSELSEFPRVIEIWIGDSDDWGYALFESGNFSCGCTLNQEHASSASQPPATAEDAAKLCDALGIPERFNAVLRAQRKRHLFADVPCEKFCQAIEAEPAIFTAGDIEQWNAGRLESCDVAGWHITPLYFEKHRRLGEEQPETMLQSIAVRSFNPDQPRRPLSPEMEQMIQANVRMMKLVILPIRLVMTPIVWMCIRGALLIGWLGKFGTKFKAAPKTDNGLSSMIARRGKPWQRDGDWLVNNRHGCRIRVAFSEAENKPAPFIFGVFTFFVGGTEILCAGVRPARVRQIYDLRTGQEAIRDESFTVGPSAARKLVTRTKEKDGFSFYYHWFVECPCAIYQFTVFTRTELPAEDEGEIDTIVRSFETFGDVHRSSPPITN